MGLEIPTTYEYGKSSLMFLVEERECCNIFSHADDVCLLLKLSYMKLLLV